VGVIGGSIPFALFFTGLKEIGGLQGALIHKTLVLWVALLAAPLLKEKISGKIIVGLVLLYAANFLAGFSGFGEWSIYHVMVLGATWLWAVENVIAKKVLKGVEADVVVFARMAMGWPILAVILLASGKADLVSQLSWQQWAAQGASALLLTGYVMTWYRGLQWAPATQVATILTGGAVVTSILQAVFVTQTYRMVQLGQAGLIVTGIWLVLTQILSRIRVENEKDNKQHRYA
jgi:drug/metabolite transporter (DMT)-like permease